MASAAAHGAPASAVDSLLSSPKRSDVDDDGDTALTDVINDVHALKRRTQEVQFERGRGAHLRQKRLGWVMAFLGVVTLTVAAWAIAQQMGVHPPPLCSAARPCRAGHTCVAGACVAARVCKTSADCGGGGDSGGCVGGFCQPKQCRSSADCVRGTDATDRKHRTVNVFCDLSSAAAQVGSGSGSAVPTTAVGTCRAGCPVASTATFAAVKAADAECVGGAGVAEECVDGACVPPSCLGSFDDADLWKSLQLTAFNAMACGASADDNSQAAYASVPPSARQGARCTAQRAACQKRAGGASASAAADCEAAYQTCLKATLCVRGTQAGGYSATTPSVCAIPCSGATCPAGTTCQGVPGSGKQACLPSSSS